MRIRWTPARIDDFEDEISLDEVERIAI